MGYGETKVTNSLKILETFNTHVVESKIMSIVGFIQNPTNRHLVIMIISVVVAIGCFSYYGIMDRVQTIQNEQIEQSKLNQILAAADEPKNITVIVLPVNQT